MKNLILLILLGVVIAIQFIRPDRSTPQFDPAQDIRQTLQPPAAVQTILENACYDCHSYETRYPWYSQVAPVSWWLDSHVREGREHLNFSTFGTLSANERAEALEEAAEVVVEGEMPLKSYTWGHPEARLGAEQRKALAIWLQATEAGNSSGAASTKSKPDSEAAGHQDDDDD